MHLWLFEIGSIWNIRTYLIFNILRYILKILDLVYCLCLVYVNYECERGGKLMGWKEKINKKEQIFPCKILLL